EEIAEKLASYRCTVILNTVYDPTDGTDMLAGRLGLEPETRITFNLVNAAIKSLARQHGSLLSDLEALFHGHGIDSKQPWYVLEIEPNLAGATAIANHWHDLLSASTR